MVAESQVSLVFNQRLARVQGCMLGKPKKIVESIDLVSLQILQKTITGLLDQVEGSRTEKEREIFLFLLINTQLKWEENLLDNDNYSSLSKICTQLTVQQFIDTLSKTGLWQFLFDSAPFLPHTVLSLLLHETAELLKKSLTASSGAAESLNSFAASDLNTTAVWTGLGKAAKFLNNEENWIKDYLSQILRPGNNKTSRIYNFLSLLTVLRGHLENSSRPQELMNFYRFHQENRTDTGTRTEILQPLLVALRAFIEDFSFESWIELSEVSSVQLMRTNYISGVWRDPHVPSHVQFIAAHLLHECATLLKSNVDGKESQDALLNVISGFSCEYRRELELNLDELKLDEILTNLKISGLEDWKIQAYLDKIVSAHLPEVLKLDENIKILSEHVSKLTGALTGLYLELTGQPDIPEFQRQFLVRIARCSSSEDLLNLLRVDLEPGRRFDVLETDSFDLEFVQALNKASGVENDEVRQDFLILALQNGEKTVETLVEEGSKNSGQIGSISRILRYLEPVCTRSKDGTSILGEIFIKYILQKRAEENSLELFLQLGGYTLIYSLQLYPSLLQTIFNLFNQNQDILVLVDLTAKILSLPEFISSLPETERNETLVLFSVLLNSTNPTQSENGFKLREVCIQVFNLLMKNLEGGSHLGSLLHPSLLSYFLAGKTPCLLSCIQYSYSQGGLVEDVVQRLLPLENLKEEILALLPILMKQEFIILLQVLVRLHDQGKILNPEQSEQLNPEQSKTLNPEQSETLSTKQSKILNLEESKILDLEQSKSFNPEQSKTLISEFKSLKIISDCVRILVLSPGMKMRVENVYLNYCSLFSGVIKTADMNLLVHLYNLSICDIAIIKGDDEELESVVNSGVGEESVLEPGAGEESVLEPGAGEESVLDLPTKNRILDLLWSVSQGSVAQLLNLAPGEEEIKSILIPLQIFKSNPGKETIIRMVENYLEK